MFCPHCGKETAENQAYCQSCGGRIDESDLPHEFNVTVRRMTPWEERETIGIVSGLLKTVQSAAVHPGEFFKKMQVNGGLTDPLLFGLIIGMIGVTFQYVWQILLQNPMQRMMTAEMQGMAAFDMLQGFGIAILAVLAPIMVIVGIFVLAGCLHVVLMMVKGAHAGFEATFRVVAYSSSPYLLTIIPFCGGIVALVWMVLLAIIGLREAHGTSGNRAAFAVLFPFIFCCGLLVLLVVLFFGALFATFGALMSH